MSEAELFPVPPEFAANAHIDEAAYTVLYRHSLEDPEGFWPEQGASIDWIKPFSEISNTLFDPPHARGAPSNPHWFASEPFGPRPCCAKVPPTGLAGGG